MRGFLIAAALVLAPAALAQPPGQDAPTSLQGEQSAWINNAHMRAFYDLTREALAGPVKMEFASYRDKSFSIFRAFGVSMGMDAEGMVDHLKDIPGQLVSIVAENPKVLDSYDTFIVALMGPQ